MGDRADRLWDRHWNRRRRWSCNWYGHGYVHDTGRGAIRHQRVRECRGWCGQKFERALTSFRCMSAREHLPELGQDLKVREFGSRRTVLLMRRHRSTLRISDTRRGWVAIRRSLRRRSPGNIRMDLEFAVLAVFPLLWIFVSEFEFGNRFAFRNSLLDFLLLF
jgi:hypothetical protein